MVCSRHNFVCVICWSAAESNFFCDMLVYNRQHFVCDKLFCSRLQFVCGMLVYSRQHFVCDMLVCGRQQFVCVT